MAGAKVTDSGDAFHVLPASGSISGAVLFLHWFDPQAPDGNRTQFLDQAKDLAGEGIACLLPQLSFPWSVEPSGSAADVGQIEAELEGLADGVEHLARRVERIVVVGHDYGAMHGLLLMAREPRLVAGAFIAPANRWADWNVRFWNVEEDRLDYMRALRTLDPIEHIGSIAPRPLLLQFAEQDFFIAGMDANELFNAAGEPRRIERYDADHALRHDQAIADRRAFILEQLGLAA